MIAPVHLEIARRWAHEGVPLDRSTVDFVPTVIAGLLEERDALHRTIADLCESLAEVPA